MKFEEQVEHFQSIGFTQELNIKGIGTDAKVLGLPMKKDPLKIEDPFFIAVLFPNWTIMGKFDFEWDIWFDWIPRFAGDLENVQEIEDICKILLKGVERRKED